MPAPCGRSCGGFDENTHKEVMKTLEPLCPTRSFSGEGAKMSLTLHRETLLGKGVFESKGTRERQGSRHVGQNEV